MLRNSFNSKKEASKETWERVVREIEGSQGKRVFQKGLVSCIECYWVIKDLNTEIIGNFDEQIYSWVEAESRSEWVESECSVR